MQNVDLSKYKALFLKTSHEYLEKLDKNLQTLKDDSFDSEATENAYLNIHSIGSQNEAMGYNFTSGLCREIELYLYEVKNNKRTLTDESINSITSSINDIKDSIDRINKSDFEINLSEKTTALKTKLNI